MQSMVWNYGENGTQGPDNLGVILPYRKGRRTIRVLGSTNYPPVPISPVFIGGPPGVGFIVYPPAPVPDIPFGFNYFIGEYFDGDATGDLEGEIWGLTVPGSSRGIGYVLEIYCTVGAC